jgi:hypothetical protein
MQKYLTKKQSDHPNQLYIIWEFCYKIMPLYLWTNIWEQSITTFVTANDVKCEEPEIYLYYDDDADALMAPIESLTHSVL